MATKQSEQPLKLLKCYKDVVGRIIRGFRNTVTKEYLIDSRLYDRNGQAISLMVYSFKTRKAWKDALKRYPKERREELQ